MFKHTSLKWVLTLALSLLTASIVAAQDSTPTVTPSGSVLELLVQSAQATEEAIEEAAGFRFSDVLLELHRERLSDGGFIIGDPDAPITIVEFADWACPHCQDY